MYSNNGDNRAVNGGNVNSRGDVPTFNITQPIQVLSEWRNEERGVYNSKEVNRVAWNGSQTARIDIRNWYMMDSDKVKKAGKGITLNDQEANELCKALIALGYGQQSNNQQAPF